MLVYGYSSFFWYNTWKTTNQLFIYYYTECKWHIDRQTRYFFLFKNKVLNRIPVTAGSVWCIDQNLRFSFPHWSFSFCCHLQLLLFPFSWLVHLISHTVFTSNMFLFYFSGLVSQSYMIHGLTTWPGMKVGILHSLFIDVLILCTCVLTLNILSLSRKSFINWFVEGCSRRCHICCMQSLNTLF